MSLKEMLELWIKITGVNPNEKKTHYTIHFDGRLSDYDIERMNEKIQEALGYDDTGLFAEAYLCHYFTEYVKQRGFRLTEYLQNTSIKEYLEDVSRLYTALQESSADKIITDEAHKAMDFYKLKSDKLSVFDIAEIRTCANNCIEKNLHTFQFASGQTQKDGFKMFREIRMYKNLNALALSAAKGKVDGVSLAYIRDEEEITYSYFAFVIKNGENLYLLTDKPVFVHPLQSSYKRCPGRDMYRRIEGNFFPYNSIANIDISDLWDSGRYGTNEKNTSLSTIFREEEEELFKTIGTIDDMTQTEAFWFVLMLSLIKENFYDKVAPQLTLSYTGSQIKHPAIKMTENALIVQSVLPSISMDRVTFDDIENLTFDEHYEEHLKSDWNQYLIDRYKDYVGEEVLNLIEEENTPLLFDRKEVKKNELKLFDLSNECGTAEELIYNQRWIARYNYAKCIQEHLQNDYNQNYTQIYADIQERIAARLEDIVVMFLQNKLVDRKPVSHHTFDNVYEGEETVLGNIKSFEKWWHNSYYERSTHYEFGSTTRYSNKSDFRCAITGDAPGVVLSVKPNSLYALCQICGCKVEELPKFIQHWGKSRHYCGNRLLDNIDPVAFVLEKDPFNEMDFSFTIVLSKKEYLRLCSVAGVEAKKFWLEEKPVCLSENEEVCGGDWKHAWEKGYFLKKKCTKCKYYKKNMKKEQVQ